MLTISSVLSQAENAGTGDARAALISALANDMTTTVLERIVEPCPNPNASARTHHGMYVRYRSSLNYRRMSDLRSASVKLSENDLLSCDVNYSNLHATSDSSDQLCA